MSEDEWGDLECLYKFCQAAETDGGLFTDIGVNKRGENERRSENNCEMKTVSFVKVPENRQELVQKTKEERIVERESFEFRVKLRRGEGKWRRRSSSNAERWRRRRLPQLFG